jgi:putative nucleotidyltransferase with HDIG domain
MSELNMLATALGNVEEFYDPFTSRGHIREVVDLSLRLAGLVGLPIEEIKLSALMHDVGKIGIPQAILGKVEPLTKEEFEIIKTHVEVGYKIALDLGFPQRVAFSIRHHHERLDGSGYPCGLKGKEIPLECQIVAVADVLGALCQERPYKRAYQRESAIEILFEEARKGKKENGIWNL